MEERNFLLIPNQRVILFPEVSHVVLDYKPPSLGDRGRSPEKWELSLNIDGEKFRIDSSTVEWSMWTLGHDISSFIGTDMIDNHGKDTSRYDPNVTREETVAKWKRRIEEETEEKRK